MIIKDNSVRLILILSFFIIFPFIQKQWFNLHLFNVNNFSLNSLLYYSSGLVWPLIISFNSLNSFTHYKFNDLKNKQNNFIKGKKLMILVLFTLVSLSILFSSYILLNLKLLFSLFFNESYLAQIDIVKYFSFIILVCILLFFTKTRLLIKKLVLVNFFIFSLLIWFCKVNSIYIESKIFTLEFISLDNIENINIILLLTFECLFFLWSLVTNKNNLSDWSLKMPLQHEFLPLFKIVSFYLVMIVYYSFLK